MKNIILVLLLLLAGCRESRWFATVGEVREAVVEFYKPEAKGGFCSAFIREAMDADFDPDVPRVVHLFSFLSEEEIFLMAYWLGYTTDFNEARLVIKDIQKNEIMNLPVSDESKKYHNKNRQIATVTQKQSEILNNHVWQATFCVPREKWERMKLEKDVIIAIAGGKQTIYRLERIVTEETGANSDFFKFKHVKNLSTQETMQK